MATLEAVQAFREEPPTGARVLGVHIEGPYFSREKPGAHPLELIRHPAPAEYEQWLAFGELVTQMTVAPELPGALELIDALVAARPARIRRAQRCVGRRSGRGVRARHAASHAHLQLHEHACAGAARIARAACWSSRSASRRSSAR